MTMEARAPQPLLKELPGYETRRKKTKKKGWQRFLEKKRPGEEIDCGNEVPRRPLGRENKKLEILSRDQQCQDNSVT